jgi:hypothetical protein
MTNGFDHWDVQLASNTSTSMTNVGNGSFDARILCASSRLFWHNTMLEVGHSGFD